MFNRIRNRKYIDILLDARQIHDKKIRGDIHQLMKNNLYIHNYGPIKCGYVSYIKKNPTHILEVDLLIDVYRKLYDKYKSHVTFRTVSIYECILPNYNPIDDHIKFTHEFVEDYVLMDDVHKHSLIKPLSDIIINYYSNIFDEHINNGNDVLVSMTFLVIIKELSNHMHSLDTMSEIYNSNKTLYIKN